MGYLSQYLTQAGLVSRHHLIRWPVVLVMGVCYDLAMVRRIIIPEDNPPMANISVGIMNPNRIPELSADNLVDIQVRTIPEHSAAVNQPVVVIRGQTGDRFSNCAGLNILSQAALHSGEVIVNRHAGTGSFCMN